MFIIYLFIILKKLFHYCFFIKILISHCDNALATFCYQLWKTDTDNKIHVVDIWLFLLQGIHLWSPELCHPADLPVPLDASIILFDEISWIVTNFSHKTSVANSITEVSTAHNSQPASYFTKQPHYFNPDPCTFK